MAEPVKLGDIIAEHQQNLQLYLVAGDPDPIVTPQKSHGYWIGPFTASHEHTIEVLEPDKLQMLAFELHNKRAEPENNSHGDQARIVILSECHDCSDSILVDMRQLNYTAYRSVQPAKPILRSLANSFAAYSTSRSQHAVALSVYGQGILLCGNSGLGKSAIALELLSRGHTLVADDLPTLARMPNSSQVYAICPPMLAELLEVRALGILDVGKLYGETASMALCPVNLIIELVEDYSSDAQSRLNPFQQSVNILDVGIPRVRIPVRHATNPAVMVETLVKNHVLYKAGDDASLQLITRQRQHIEKQTL